MRPKMTQLLKDIEEEIYDAVCVVEYDRLSRGDLGEQDRIKKAFQKSNTLIITPEKIYDLNNDLDDTYVDFKGLFARQEYKMISKRFKQGKQVGSRRGNWTNGTPPYPYEYERYKDKYNEKGLVVNDEKLVIYRFIIDSAINSNLTPNQIAWELNKRNITSPRNSIWHGLMVYRILLDETHLGKIISNKTTGDGHKIKKPNSKDIKENNKDEWVIVENCHEAVKTLHEHEKVLLFLSRLNRTQRRKPNEDNVMPLSGLIKCGLCGHTMSIYYRGNRKNPESLKPCWYTNEVGNKCINRGTVIEVFYNEIQNTVDQNKGLMMQIFSANNVNNESDSSLGLLKQSVFLKEKTLTRIQEAYENGVYDLNQYNEKKLKVEQDKAENFNEIKKLETKSAECEHKLLNNQVKIFLNDIRGTEIDNITKNKILKAFIDKIVWTRIGKQAGNIDIVLKRLST
jgi:DNA invertase Pin-like site-specific DNA recombinase